jgi:hypothetical protein
MVSVRLPGVVVLFVTTPFPQDTPLQNHAVARTVAEGGRKGEVYEGKQDESLPRRLLTSWG